MSGLNLNNPLGAERRRSTIQMDDMQMQVDQPPGIILSSDSGHPERILPPGGNKSASEEEKVDVLFGENDGAQLRLGGGAAALSMGQALSLYTKHLGQRLSMAENTDSPKLQLPEYETNRFECLFSALDCAADDTIPISEVVISLRLMGLHIPETLINELLSSILEQQKRCTRKNFIRFISEVKKKCPPDEWGSGVDRIAVICDNASKDNHSRNDKKSDLIKSILAGTRLWLADSKLHWVADALVLMCTFYYSVIIPVHIISSEMMYATRPYILGLELAATAVFLLDVVMRSQTLYVNSLMERESHYLFSVGMSIDLLAALPLDLILYGVDVVPQYKYAYILRGLKWFRLESLFAFSGVGLITASHVRCKYGYVPLAKTILKSIIFIHVCSCLFVIASCSDSSSKTEEENPCDNSLGDRYLEALYWALYTVSSVGYGDVPIENNAVKILAMTLFVCALILNGWLIGKMTSYMMALDTKGEHRELMNRTLQVIEHFSLDADIVEDILSLQEHLLSQKVHLRSFSDVMQRLPTTVQSVLTLYIRVEYLSHVPLFQSCPTECRISLAQSLLHSVCARGDVVVVEGEVGDAMFVLVHGFAEVSKNGKVVASLMRGSFFGEQSLLEKTKRTASVSCLSYCEVLQLKKEEFKDVTERHPVLLHNMLQAVAKEKNLPEGGTSFNDLTTQLAPKASNLRHMKNSEHNKTNVITALSVERFLKKKRLAEKTERQVQKNAEDTEQQENLMLETHLSAPVDKASFMRRQPETPFSQPTQMLGHNFDSRLDLHQLQESLAESRRASIADDETMLGSRAPTFRTRPPSPDPSHEMHGMLHNILMNQKILNKKLNRLLNDKATGRQDEETENPNIKRGGRRSPMGLFPRASIV